MTTSYLSRTITRRGQADTSTLKQVAFYKNAGKGEELINWAIDYSYDGSKTKTITTYDYDTTANKTDCLRNVKVYKSEVAAADIDLANNTRPTPAANTMKSNTAYIGDEKGEEIIDYTDNYIVGNTTVNTRTTYFYGSGFARASNAMTTKTCPHI